VDPGGFPWFFPTNSAPRAWCIAQPAAWPCCMEEATEVGTIHGWYLNIRISENHVCFGKYVTFYFAMNF